MIVIVVVDPELCKWAKSSTLSH